MGLGDSYIPPVLRTSAPHGIIHLPVEDTIISFVVTVPRTKNLRYSHVQNITRAIEEYKRKAQ